MFKLLIFILIIITTRIYLIATKDVYYNFETYYFCGAPDGVTTCNILGVNGQFPGPKIEASIGDTLHIRLTNGIQLRNGIRQNVTLHYHGLLQRGTPFQDGPEMVTQCSIPWNHTMEYKFKLEQAGTYWWHSHVHWQYSGGMWGSLIIHNKPEVYAADYDDEILITLNDWYHTSGLVNTEWFLSPASKGNEPIPFSLLLNGHGSYRCTSTHLPCDIRKQIPPIFQVQKGKRYRIRVINTSSITTFIFSIEDHSLTVIEVDGVDTVKVTFDDKIPIAPAQRYSFIVQMDGNETEYCIRAKADLGMFAFDEPNINLIPEALITTVTALLRYDNIDEKQISSTDTDKSETLQKICEGPDEEDQYGTGFPGESLLRPYDGISAPEHFDQNIVFNVDPVEDEAGINYLTFNEIIYRLSEEPLLVMALQNKTLPHYSNPITVEYRKVIQIVINNRDTGSHPFHLHGHTFWVIGVGSKNASDYNESRDGFILNTNGVRRDTVQVEAESWAVIRFITDNPGVWIFHCHINWHLQSGLAATIVEAQQEMRENLTITADTRRICAAQGINIEEQVLNNSPVNYHLGTSHFLPWKFLLVNWAIVLQILDSAR